jgi:SAM-dependent methyltransferase
MGIDSYFYRLTYRHGSPRWDSTEPRPELQTLIAARPPGRALDLGCGTGTTAGYLAQHGWDVVGIDFVPEAIATATARVEGTGTSVCFVVGDVTRLAEAGVEGPFDLLIDIGCYHAIPARRRDAYAEGVAAVAAPGADLYLAGIARPPVTWRLLGATGLNTTELLHRFGDAFTLADQHTTEGAGRLGTFTLHHLIRTR